jgi:hypothetical protein
MPSFWLACMMPDLVELPFLDRITDSGGGDLTSSAATRRPLSS